MRRCMPPFPVNLAAVVAAEAALGDSKTMQAYINEVKRLCAWLAEELKKLRVKTYPSAGNFLLANFSPRGPELFRQLEKRGILLRDRIKDIRPGIVLISIGTSFEMKRLLKTIRKQWKP